MHLLTKKLTLGIIMSLPLMTTTHANDGFQGAMKTCLIVKNDQTRLACYDNLAKSSKSSKTTAAPRRAETKKTKTPAIASGRWIYQESKDALSGNIIHSLATESVSGVSRFKKKFVLFLRCTDDKAEVFVTWHDFMGSKPVEVTFKVGEDEPKKQKWSTSSDKKSTFARNPVKLIQSFEEQQQIVFRASPWKKSPHTAIFSLKGYDEAAEKFKVACNI